ncbi:MAG: adenine phosphoribosyltransferase [Candidatus Aminicenantes bacterium]|nr:adenine phosphoribosyltransferase [Candidatus Aminicenantes bacterium]
MIPAAKKHNLKKYIRNIPDFPKRGILFRDITPLLNNKRALKVAINLLSAKFKDKKIDVVVAAEARGFILAGPVAQKINAGFVPVRKKGKLPWRTYKASYSLEYGVDTLEMHQDAFKPGARVLILDDLLATGGTVKAIIDLVKQLHGKIIGICFLIELADLNGRKKLKGHPVYSLIKY